MNDEKKPDGYWNDRENCLNAAKGFKTVSEFRKKYPGAYIRSWKNGWLKDYDWFEETRKPNGYWTVERSLEEAKKYKTRNDFERNCYGAWDTLRKSGLLGSCGFDETRKPNGFYTRDKCFELAKKCRTVSEFQKKYPTAYKYSLKNGWLEDYDWMPKAPNSKPV